MYWISEGHGGDYALLPFKGTGRIGPRIPVNTRGEDQASGTAGKTKAPAGGSTAAGTSGSTAPGEGESLSPTASEATGDNDLGDWGVISMVSQCGSFVMVDPESNME